MATKIGVISLGCSKNLVDTEVMLGILKEAGYEFVQDMSQADVVLINTCTFIEQAKEEAFGAILEAGQQKRYGTVKGIVVTGCMPEQLREKLRTMAPEVDVWMGTTAYKNIVSGVEKAVANDRVDIFTDLTMAEDCSKRVITTRKPTAYIKIAEGCDNACTYCVIPKVRGRAQSRPIKDIVEEAKRLVSEGYTEIVLVAQDTTRYGMDLPGGKMLLPQLLDEVAAVPGLKWLRVLYMYPDRITQDLLGVMTKHDNIVKYIDMPIQHLSDRVLKAMNRENTRQSSLDALARIRKADPSFVVRSTVIVGFPGETHEDFVALMDGLREARFDRLGVFQYSRETGTPAYDFPDQIDDETKEWRQDAIMNQQATIAYDMNRARIGMPYDVLIEGYDDRNHVYYGRTYGEAPEVDGLMMIHSKDELDIGSFYNARVVQAFNYDCQAEIIPAEEPQ